MIRQSISVTTPNDNWLNSLIESEEYNSKSEIINDLIRKARSTKNQIELINTKLMQSENSGFIDMTPEEIKAEFKRKLRLEGKL